jgi:hypothetical protein
LVKTQDFPIYLPNSQLTTDKFKQAKDEYGEYIPSEFD